MTPESRDDDRTQWELAWRDRPLRRIALPVRIDVRPSPNPEWGEPTVVLGAAAPPEFADRVAIGSEICPVCGVRVAAGARLAVILWPEFSRGAGIGVGAWAHIACFAACEEAPGRAPIPW